MSIPGPRGPDDSAILGICSGAYTSEDWRAGIRDADDSKTRGAICNVVQVPARGDTISICRIAGAGQSRRRRNRDVDHPQSRTPLLDARAASVHHDCSDIRRETRGKDDGVMPPESAALAAFRMTGQAVRQHRLDPAPVSFATHDIRVEDGGAFDRPGEVVVDPIERR
jgi:hypothetical protein